MVVEHGETHPLQWGPARRLGGSMTRHEGLSQAEAPQYLSGRSPRFGAQANDTGDTANAGEASVHLAEGGPLVLRLPAGQVVTGTMALRAAQNIEGIAGTTKLPLLLILSGVESITRGARDIFSAARSLSAVAVLGISPVDRVIANFLLGGEVQPCPTRYFSRESDALLWLKRFLA